MTVSGSANTPKGSANRRYWIIGILAVLLLGFFLFVGAPASQRIETGSTWGKDPDGYGAWFDYMAENGTPIERWQRPISELVEQTTETSERPPATVIRVIPPLLSVGGRAAWESGLSDWLERGDRLIVLTQQQSVTAAKFSTQIASEAGEVTVNTRRRYPLRSLPSYQQEGTEVSFEAAPSADKSETVPLLADDYGAVVWRQSGQSNAVLSTTPFLAANAYQAAPGNFAFLADLANEANGPVWVDEYLHGYKDRDVVVEEVAGTWLGYLAKTPLMMAAVQIGVILLVALIAQNRRVGSKQPLLSPQMNNSEAYIKALAGVLHKANNQDFLVETLVAAEQKSLQRSLGLGEAAVSLDVLQTAWQQSTGRSVEELSVLQAKPRGEAALQSWLQQLQALVPKVSRPAGQTIKS